jgi:hypothetical protein
MVAVVDGRNSLLHELEASPPELRTYVGEAIRGLIAEPRFLDALPGHLLPDAANQARLGQLTEKLQALSRLR